jgi:hypothetical protein
MSAKESEFENKNRNLKSEWRKSVSENIKSLAARFNDINSDKRRLELARKILK